MAQSDNETRTVLERAKDLLSDHRYRIALHDLVAEETRKLLSSVSDKEMPTGAGWSDSAFVERVAKYDQLTADLVGVEALLGYWGQDVHANILTLAPRRLADGNRGNSGSTGWLAMRWYPVMRLLYCGGIAAIATGNYANLRQLLLAGVPDPDSNRRTSSLAVSVIAGVQNAREAFKKLPGHERQHVPLNEYLFASLAPVLDELLFLGGDYEACFDRFEILLALVHADIGDYGVPFGRFAWKHSGMREDGPVNRLLAEAEAYGDRWPPIQSGLFSASSKRFKEVALQFSQSLGRLNW